MNNTDIVNQASNEVGYHEKVTNTPIPALYYKQNSYDGSDNWTKYHNDIGAPQGADWCGYFCYWNFYQQCNQDHAQTRTFLHNIQNLGGAVSDWYNAFNSAGKFHVRGSYDPKIGDVVLFSDPNHPWSHCEIVTGLASAPTYINTVGGNTRLTSGSGEATGMWVASRIRHALANANFWVYGYCEVDYDGSSSPGEFAPEWGYPILRRKRNGWLF